MPNATSRAGESSAKSRQCRSRKNPMRYVPTFGRSTLQVNASEFLHRNYHLWQEPLNGTWPLDGKNRYNSGSPEQCSSSKRALLQKTDRLSLGCLVHLLTYSPDVCQSEDACSFPRHEEQARNSNIDKMAKQLLMMIGPPLNLGNNSLEATA